MDYITRKEISLRLNITESGVQKRAERMGIKATRLTSKGKRIYAYTVEEAKRMGLSFEKIPEAEHPLVTDPRWMKLSEWPDTMPACFQGLDD